jgi:hypothetical protein
MKHKEKWGNTDIKKAAKIILEAEKKKHILIKILDEIIHWFLILLILFGNLIMDVFIVFLSILVGVKSFYFVVMLLALVFGIMIEIPLRDIKKLDKQKHFFSRLMLPLLALLNIYILMGAKNTIELITGKNFQFNPVIIGIIYGVFMLAPHFIGLLLSKRVASGI